MSLLCTQNQTASMAAACCWWMTEAALIILFFAYALQSQRIDFYSNSVDDSVRKVEADKAGETL